MDQVHLTKSFAETPKDGGWYQLPNITQELSEFIRWDKRLKRWDWMMLKDDVAVIEVSYISEHGANNES